MASQKADPPIEIPDPPVSVPYGEEGESQASSEELSDAAAEALKRLQKQ